MGSTSVGSSWATAPIPGTTDRTGFVWQDGGSAPTSAVLVGGSGQLDINDRGQVVEDCWGGRTGRAMTFVWQDGVQWWTLAP